MKDLLCPLCHSVGSELQIGTYTWFYVRSMTWYFAMARRAKRSLESQTHNTRSQSVLRRKRAEATGSEGEVERQKERECR